MHSPNLIIGAGLAGLSTSYHLGHDRCLLLEASDRPFGIVDSQVKNNFTWDKGPHASFTSSAYVKNLFTESAEDGVVERPVLVGNYCNGYWINHPAQVNLYQIPEPLRSECKRSFLESRKQLTEHESIHSYKDWLYAAFGGVFAEAFPTKYTRKYWTVNPAEMATEWVGSRVYRPDPDDVIAGAAGALSKKCHYVKTIRYPLRGGYKSFAEKLANGANIRLRTKVMSIDLEKKAVTTSSGEKFSYDRLISTMPLPQFIFCCRQKSKEMKNAAEKLLCTEVQIVNVEIPYICPRPESWLYVYNEDFLSTRINFTERLSPYNAPCGCSGIQVEVYGSKRRAFKLSSELIEQKVLMELQLMGLIEDAQDKRIKVHSIFLPYANVTFLQDTAAQLDRIWSELSQFGLLREADDTHPMTDWNSKSDLSGELIMAGRFGQWKYYWSDDCVLRGLDIARKI